MGTWRVILPITGVIEVEVEADSEESAIEAAFESDLTSDQIAEWEAHRQIVRGNVFYGTQNEAEAEELP